MKISCIYIIRSIVKPERFYIGSAVNFITRKACHITELKNNYHHSKKMQRHANKYGVEDLKFEILLRVYDAENLIKEEQRYLDMFSPYFNSAKVAGSNLGMKFGPISDKHREIISKFNKGKIVSQGFRDSHSVKIRKYDIDGNLLKEYKSCLEARISEGVLIKPLSETNLTIKGFVWVTENSGIPDFSKIKNRLAGCKKVLCKKVLQIDKHGNVVNEFDGVRIACKKTGIDHRSISQVASGSNIRKTAGGFIWEYSQQEKGGNKE